MVIRIFRTDYGHTEVAAFFGNGKEYYELVVFSCNFHAQIRESIRSQQRNSFLMMRGT
jgi:hypothetical protein